jgi:hypothetical protein
MTVHGELEWMQEELAAIFRPCPFILLECLRNTGTFFSQGNLSKQSLPEKPDATFWS